MGIMDHLTGRAQAQLEETEQALREARARARAERRQREELEDTRRTERKLELTARRSLRARLRMAAKYGEEQRELARAAIRDLQKEKQELTAAGQLVEQLRQQLAVRMVSAMPARPPQQLFRRLPDGTPTTLSYYASWAAVRMRKLDTKLRLRSIELGELRKTVDELRGIRGENRQLREQLERAVADQQAEAALRLPTVEQRDRLQAALKEANRHALEQEQHLAEARMLLAKHERELAAVEQELAECREAADKPDLADMRRMVTEDLQRRINAGTMTLAEARDAVRVQP